MVKAKMWREWRTVWAVDAACQVRQVTVHSCLAEEVGEASEESEAVSAADGAGWWYAPSLAFSSRLDGQQDSFFTSEAAAVAAAIRRAHARIVLANRQLDRLYQRRAVLALLAQKAERAWGKAGKGGKAGAEEEDAAECAVDEFIETLKGA
jgi:hypothetical protein